MVTCYMCEAPKTSDEHVPPKCLFPEKKDLPSGDDYRKNLIQVPSCDEHNSEKSKEDEYFFMCLAACSPGNKASINHQNNKLLRILEKQPGKWQALIKQATPATVIETDGSIHETCAFHIDETRFFAQLEHIAKGIYFKNYGKKWLTTVDIRILQGLHVNDSNIRNENQKIHHSTYEIFADAKKYGENQEVFSYQIKEGRTAVLILITFYEYVKILISYSDSAM